MDSGSKPLPMRPQGLTGRLFGIVMERMNRGAYRRALALLAPRAGERFLEIGFGTGRFAELLLASAPDVRVAGVDPTPTMVEVANRRRGVRAAGARADLREGLDQPLAFDAASLDAVVALHSFQFWPDPGVTLTEARRVLAPGGRLVVVLRDHRRDAPDWLPNPVSRGHDEPAAAARLVREAGFAVDTHATGGDPLLIVGRVPGERAHTPHAEASSWR